MTKMAKTLNWFLVCLIIFKTEQVFGENILTVRQNELFPVSIIHMNDFHARLLYETV